MPYTKSCATTGSPLDHLAFWRSLNTHVVGFVCFQLSATPGTMLPAESFAVRPSNRSRVMLLAPTDSALAGSSVSGSEPLLRISVCEACSCTPGGSTAAAAPNARNSAASRREIFFIFGLSVRSVGRQLRRVDVDIAPEGVGEGVALPA